MKKLLLLLAAGFFTASFAHATVVAYSPPVGGMTITVPTGQTASVALPLLHAPVGSGAVIGTITATGSNYIDVSDAGWTPASFSTTANPYYLRITSGPAAGRVMQVATTANTATRLYVINDGVDLTGSGGPVAGNAYEIVLADTLNSFFGNATLAGGPDANSSDNVQIWNGASWQIYYYNTTRNRWELRGLTALSANNAVLRPDRGIMITRRAATEFKMYVGGRVPGVAPVYFHSRSGVTFLSTGIPVTQTLSQFGLQTRAAGWVSGTSITNADTLQIWNGASWQIYFYSSVNNRWQLNGLPSLSANNANIGNRPIMVRRLNAAAAGDSLITLPLPYTIN